ncbi:hypothetical protein GCM10009734_28890 [Nonomuraea bangladeshensis]
MTSRLPQKTAGTIDKMVPRSAPTRRANGEGSWGAGRAAASLTAVRVMLDPVIVTTAASRIRIFFIGSMSASDAQ